MALIKFPECGKEISDKAFSCPYCGFPILYTENNKDDDEHEYKNYSDIPHKPHRIKRNETIFGAILIFLLMFAIVLKLKDVADNKDTVVASSESASEESSAVITTSEISYESIEESEISTETLPTEIKEEFIASCQVIPYKTLARTPDDYIGQRIVLTVKINQVMQGGWFDDNEYYRVCTNDEYNMWLGDEYFMYDSRLEDTTKILSDDIWKVYAEFIGTETVTRALSGTKEDIPAIKVYYADLVSE